MPWRDDFVGAFWVDPQFGLRGDPDGPSSPDAPSDAAMRLADRVPAGGSVTTEYVAGWPQRASAPAPKAAIIVMRDRIGFKYERVVGLDDFVSQREAAQLLGLPTMTVNRWVRARKLDSKKRNGYVVLRVRDVLAVGQETGCRLRMGGKLVVIGSGGLDDPSGKPSRQARKHGTTDEAGT